MVRAAAAGCRKEPRAVARRRRRRLGLRAARQRRCLRHWTAVETQGNRQCLSRRGHWSHRQQRGLAKARREVLDTDAVGQRALAGQPVQERNDLDVALRPRRASQVWGRIGSGRTREGRGTLSHTLSVSVCVCVSAVLCVWLLCAAVLCAALLCCVPAPAWRRWPAACGRWWRARQSRRLRGRKAAEAHKKAHTESHSLSHERQCLSHGGRGNARQRQCLTKSHEELHDACGVHTPVSSKGSRPERDGAPKRRSTRGGRSGRAGRGARGKAVERQ